MKSFAKTLLVISLAGYPVIAYIVPLWPFAPEPVRAATGCVDYQVAIDISGSNQERGNWRGQADNFAGRLKPCDRVSFWIVDGATSTHAEAREPIVMPLVDSNASVLDRAAQSEKLKDARETVRGQLQNMITRTAPASNNTDLLGLFKQRPESAWPLSPVAGVVLAGDQPVNPAGADNQWVIFSDGLESYTPNVNLEGPEHGGRCVNSGTRQALVNAALKVLSRNDQLAGFSRITWVIPEGAGRTGCNSRHEVATFWAPVIRAISSDPMMPVVQFQTNPFTRGQSSEN